MPTKTCPECSKQWGPRKLQCDNCGHEFGKSKSEQQSVSEATKIFGTWMADVWKDAKNVPEPEPIPHDRKLTLNEIRDYICYEGIGECIIGYIQAEKIADKILAKKWKRAHDAMKEVLDYVYY
jgi:hypothetical protein